MTFVVGLTGGIGCGKSTIEKFFGQLGAHIIDTDLIAHALQQPGKAGYVYIKQFFGDAYISFNGTIDRAMLRKHVFNNAEAKETLERLMSPLIYHVVQEKIAQFESAGTDAPYIILTVPLLFEPRTKGTFLKFVDTTLAIDCPESVQEDRVMLRSGLSRREVQKIIQSQVPSIYRVMKADAVIHNVDCKPEDHFDTVKEMHERYVQMAQAKKGE